MKLVSLVSSHVLWKVNFGFLQLVAASPQRTEEDSYWTKAGGSSDYSGTGRKTEDVCRAEKEGEFSSWVTLLFCSVVFLYVCSFVCFACSLVCLFLVCLFLVCLFVCVCSLFLCICLFVCLFVWLIGLFACLFDWLVCLLVSLWLVLFCLYVCLFLFACLLILYDGLFTC